MDSDAASASGDVAPRTPSAQGIPGLPRALVRRVGERLVKAAAAGDREAFDRLFDGCFARVYALAWKLEQDSRRAEERTRAIFVEAVQGALSADAGPPPRTP